MDGTHFNCCPSAAERQALRDRKGAITQNCLAICSFDMKFLYVFSGWEGSASDSTMFHDARVTDLPVPPGKYYLADAGFPLSSSLVIPFRGKRYHLKEWGRANLQSVFLSVIYYDQLIILIFRPQDAEELFNLRHASARNVIERIFGVVKRRFRILVHPPEYDLDVQARLPPALAALHNFIREHDPDDLAEYEGAEDPQPGVRQDPEGAGELARGVPRAPERNQAVRRRDQIAQAMWVQYQEELERRRNEV